MFDTSEDFAALKTSNKIAKHTSIRTVVNYSVEDFINMTCTLKIFIELLKNKEKSKLKDNNLSSAYITVHSFRKYWS